MTMHRSAMGKLVDMAALQAKNERVRAVGNMKVNARGDTIDSNGNVIKPVTATVSDAYAKTVGNRSAQVVKKAQKAQKAQKQPENPQPKVDELTKEELELNEVDDGAEEIEAIKAKETKEKEEKAHGQQTSVQRNKDQ